MKSRRKRGAWFVILTIWTTLVFSIGMAVEVYLLNTTIKILGGWQNISLSDQWVGLSIPFTALICLLIAFVGLAIMFISLKRVGYYIYSMGLGLLVVSVVYINIKYGDLLLTANQDIYFIAIWSLAQALLFLPVFFTKLNKKVSVENKNEGDQTNVNRGTSSEDNLNSENHNIAQKRTAKKTVVYVVGVIILLILIGLIAEKKYLNVNSGEVLADSVNVENKEGEIISENKSRISNDDFSHQENQNNYSQSDELVSKTKGILKSRVFNYTNLSDWSGVTLVFDDNNFKMVHFTLAGILFKAVGTYQISPPIDDSFALITLNLVGSIQKSEISADKNGIDAEIFFLRNRELFLKSASNSDLPTAFSSNSNDLQNDYNLIGKDLFEGKRELSKEEQDSIANQESEKQKKIDDLEEKLKGL